MTSTILVVDDDPLILRTLSRVLGHSGYRVVTHDAGFGLSEAVRQHRPDLLVLDVNMPGLGGDGALAALRALADRFRTLDVPAVFHSGLPPARLEVLAREHGAVGHLCKPATNAAILNVVARCLRESVPLAASG